jgi:polyisoprenoid-binding protein YceI
MLARLLLLLFLMPAAAQAAPWKLDPETQVTVEVPWRGSTVAVRFPTLSGTIDFDEAHPERAKAAITVAAGDAETGVAVVDQLVRSRDYLATDRFPTISFQLDRLTRTSKATADITGRITLRGVTEPIDFKAQVTRYGPAEDDPSRFEAGFDLTGEIDRTAFGSTGGLPDVAAVLPVRIRLLMSSR